MVKKKTNFARRTWSLLRLALLWARKGGAFKRGLMVDIRLLPNYIRSLCQANNHDAIFYREKEFSFDETPIFQFKIHRPASMRFHMPNLPCIKPRVDFDFDFDFDFDLNGDDEDGGYTKEGRKSFLRGDDREEDYGCDCEDDGVHTEIVAVEDEGIDRKAEEYIAKFYEQMKLQRQISYLQYNEMINRGTS